MGSFVLFYTITLHLKYEYKQIKERIQQCVKSKNSLLIKAIKDHNRCSEIVNKFNKEVKFALFIIYFFATPAVDVLINLTIYKSINVYMRIISGLLTIQVVFALYLFTYTASSLSKSAHDLISESYTFMARNVCNLSNKLKILAFIEKLNGPIIGFYCYDLFAFTTFEFYKYMIFTSSIYILLSNLLFEI